MGFLSDVKGNAPVRMVKRASDTLPATTSEDLFSSNGLIKLLGIVGRVTTVIQTQACNAKLTFDPDSGNADVDLCANADITADAVGTLLTITGTVANALVETTGVEAILATASPLWLGAGDIKLTTGATNTGEIEWFLIYQPVEKVDGKWAEVVAV